VKASWRVDLYAHFTAIVSGDHNNCERVTAGVTLPTRVELLTKIRAAWHQRRGC